MKCPKMSLDSHPSCELLYTGSIQAGGFKMDTLQKGAAGKRSKPTAQISAEHLSVAAAMRVNDTAAFLGVSRATIYNLISEGVLPSLKIGGRRVIRRSDALALLHNPLKPTA